MFAQMLFCENLLSPPCLCSLQCEGLQVWKSPCRRCLRTKSRYLPMQDRIKRYQPLPLTFMYFLMESSSITSDFLDFKYQSPDRLNNRSVIFYLGSRLIALWRMSIRIWENTLIRTYFTSYCFIFFPLMTTDIAAEAGSFRHS